MNLPGILAERVYALYDPNNKGYILEKDFMKNCQRILSPLLENKEKLVFDLLDFNQDGKIEKSDISTLLSHIPLQKTVCFY